MIKHLLLILIFFVGISFPLLGQIPGKPNVTSPANNANEVSQFPNLTWTGSAELFNVEISTDPNFGFAGNMSLGDYRYIAGPINITAEEDNLSGVVYSTATNTLFAVINNPTKIIELDLNGSHLRTIDLISFDDTEGITHIKNQTFAVVEEAKSRVVFFDISNATTSINFDTDAYSVEILERNENNSGLEAISYDPVANQVWVLKEENPRQIISFPFQDSYPTVPTLSTPFDIETDSLGLIDLSGLQHMGAAQSMDYRGANDHLLVLSHRSKNLLEIDGGGNVYGEIELLKNQDSNLSENLVRPEGITIDRNGVIYVVEEATASTPNRLFKFRNSAIQANTAPSSVYGSFGKLTCNSDDVPASTLESNSNYFLRVQGQNASQKGPWSNTKTFTTGSSSGVPNTAGLASPADNDSDQTLTPFFQWAGNATTYELQISDEDCFESPVHSETDISGTDFTLGEGILRTNTSYYWRIRGKNQSGDGPWSASRRLRTNSVLSVKSQNSSALSVYPNPVKNLTTLNFRDQYSGPIQIRILDLLGKERMSVQLFKSAQLLEHSLDFSQYTDGLYLVEIKMGTKSKLLRVLKR